MTGTQADDAGVDHGLLEVLAGMVRLLDEVEEHDDVADDDAHQADDSQERHEAERGVHHPETEDRSYHAVGGGGQDQQGLDRIVELEEQGKVDAGD